MLRRNKKYSASIVDIWIIYLTMRFSLLRRSNIAISIRERRHRHRDPSGVDMLLILSALIAASKQDIELAKTILRPPSGL